jgi:hypothetical protein
VERGCSAGGSTVFNINGGSAAGAGSVATTTGAGFDFGGVGSGLLALLPLPVFGAGFTEGPELDESSLAGPDFGSAFAAGFAAGFASDFGNGARVADFIALSNAGWKDSPVSLLFGPMRAARRSGANGACAPPAGIDIRTRPVSARRAPKRSR